MLAIGHMKRKIRFHLFQFDGSHVLAQHMDIHWALTFVLYS
jgi:hypothetical protein